MTLITHMGEIIQYLFFHDWFIALSMAKFAHAVALVKLPFLREAEYHPTVCTDHILIIHLSIRQFRDSFCSHLWWLRKVPLWTRVYKYLFESLLSILKLWSLAIGHFWPASTCDCTYFFFTGEYGESHSRQISLPVGSNHQNPLSILFSQQACRIRRV